MYKNETIAAIATGISDSGIGIIRISGDNALSIISSIFQPYNKNIDVKNMKSYSAHYGSIYDDLNKLDEVIILFMKGPHSYTTEDIIEINCHGGMLVCRKVLELVCKKGARLAEPGEFTKRAFLNGRIDLSQSEAIMDLIEAKNEFALSNSLKQLNGDLNVAIKNMRSKIINHIAFIENALDDPEHNSLEGFSEKLLLDMNEIKKNIDHYLNHFDDGRIRKSGINTLIIGKPNVGKSSLLNSLLGEERAIVTDIEGTTRDTLEENINIKGISFNIIDTAGIRESDDMIEMIGVKKALSKIEEADLILYIIDSSKELDKNDTLIMNEIKDKKVIVLYNKVDLLSKVDINSIELQINAPIINMSIKDRKGFEDFYDEIEKMFFKGDIMVNDETYITNERHKEALSYANESINRVIDSINQDMPEDFFSIDLMDAYVSLGNIIGESLGEDLVEQIFSKFCTGK